jgi:hypothetical protein
MIGKNVSHSMSDFRQTEQLRPEQMGKRNRCANDGEGGVTISNGTALCDLATSEVRPRLQ